MAIEDFGSHPYSRKELATVKERGSYHPDGITERAVKFLKQDHDAPFLLMVSHFYVHTPIQSPYAWLLDKYESKIPKKIPDRKERITYAAFLETLDHYIGQMLNGLDDAGLAGNTLVVFLSDNGGHPLYVSNKPLRGSKWNLYEGGIRVPMFVRWPGVVTAGSVCDQPVIGYDLFPTFAEVSGAQFRSNETARDGKSLLPLLKESQQENDRFLYWHFPYYHPEGSKFGNARPLIGVDDFAVSQTRPHSAIRQGDYKLIYFDEDQRTELYDLSRDISEQKDLSEKYPSRSQSMKESLINYLDSVLARRAVRNTSTR